MKHICTLLFVLISGHSLLAQHSRSTPELTAHRQMINGLLQMNGQGDAAMKTTAGVLMQRVVAQSTRDNTLLSLSDSVRVRYTGQRGSAYSYNDMLYPYNYTYSTTPMFNYAGVFTTPQVLADTYVHWTIDPFVMPAFTLYEATFATYDTNNNLKTFREIFVDSATNDNRSYVNTFTAANNINSGFWFNLNAGVADSAFKQFFTYNTSGKLVKDSVYELHLGVWRIAARTNYTYDGSGNLTLIDHFANMTDTSFLLPLIQQSKYVNTYDASNRLTTVLTSFFNGTTLGAYVKDTFGYSGTLTYHNSWKQHQYDAIHTTWWPQYFMSKHIAAGKPDTVYHNGWDSIANMWSPISKDIVGYNSYNNPDTMYKYEWNWTSYSSTPDYTTVYYYDTFTYTAPTTQVATIEQSSMRVFPNPATGNITISLSEAANKGVLYLSVMNMNGQIISRQSVHSQPEITVPVSDLTPGMYWVLIEDKNGGNRYRKQFVKQ